MSTLSEAVDAWVPWQKAMQGGAPAIHLGALIDCARGHLSAQQVDGALVDEFLAGFDLVCEGGNVRDLNDEERYVANEVLRAWIEHHE